MTVGESQLLAQQALCGLDSVAKSIGWTRPQVAENMFRMRSLAELAREPKSSAPSRAKADRLCMYVDMHAYTRHLVVCLQSLIVDCSKLSLGNWLPCIRCIIRVIKAIQPFVSPFYDRLPGDISVLDPPPAWLMVQPWLGQPTREVVHFVKSADLKGSNAPELEAESEEDTGPGGLLEVVNMICTPTTKSAKELREFGKDALFDSLFPDLKQFKEEYDSKGGWWEVWLMLGFIVLLFVGLGALMYLTAPLSKQNTVTTTTTLLTSTLAAAGGSNAEL
eukprot:s1072_g10.t1